MANYLLAGGLGLVVGAVGGWLGLQSWGTGGEALPGQCKAYIALPEGTSADAAAENGAKCLAAIRVGEPLTPPDLSAPESTTDTTAPATEPAAVPAEGPAYLIVVGNVKDREAFGAGYAAKLPELYARFGGEYIAIGRGVEILEGDMDFQSFVIARWPSMQAGRDFWNSPEYDELRRARIDNDWGEFDVFLIPGLPETTQVAPMVSDTAPSDDNPQ